MPQTSAVPDRSTAGLTDASPAEPRLPDAGPLDPEAFRYIATTPVRIGRTSRPILQRAGISAGGLNTFLRSLRTLVTHATDAGFRRRPADVWTEIQFNRTTFYRYLRCAITAGSAATEPAGTRGVVLFTFPRAGGTLRDEQSRSAGRFAHAADEQSRSAGRFVTSSPAQRDASPGGTVVVKSEIKEREIRTRSTTTTDQNLPDYLEPKPAPIVQDPEIATSKQVRMVRKLAKKLGLEWPTEAEARAMSREQADAARLVLDEHEAGGGMTSAAAGLSGAVDALTRPAAPPRKQRPTDCKHPAPKEEHGAWFCDDCGITLRNYTPDLGADDRPNRAPDAGGDDGDPAPGRGPGEPDRPARRRSGRHRAGRRMTRQRRDYPRRRKSCPECHRADLRAGAAALVWADPSSSTPSATSGPRRWNRRRRRNAVAHPVRDLRPWAHHNGRYQHRSAEPHQADGECQAPPAEQRSHGDPYVYRQAPVPTDGRSVHLPQPRNRSAATTRAAIATPAVTRRQARRDSSRARAVSKWARVTSSPVASELASRATSTTATASGSLAPASVSVFTAACVSKAMPGRVARGCASSRPRPALPEAKATGKGASAGDGTRCPGDRGRRPRSPSEPHTDRRGRERAKFNTESTPNEYRIDNGEGAPRHQPRRRPGPSRPASAQARCELTKCCTRSLQFCARNMAYQDKRGHVSMRPDMGGRMSTARHVDAFLQGGLAA